MDAGNGEAMMRIFTTTLLFFLAAGLAASQDEPIPMQFFEVRAAEPRAGRIGEDASKLHEQNPKCFETPVSFVDVIFAAGWCGLPLEVEGLNVSEVISISQEAYCVRIVELGALPLYHEARSLVACEYTRELINETRIAAGMSPVHIP
jgi:hypothetical protein